MMFNFIHYLRPPGAISEENFLRQCVRCGKCLTICPQGSLRLAGGVGRARGTPYVDAQNSPCCLCLKCPPVCPTGALDASIRDIAQVKMGQAYIRKDLCYNYAGGTMCSTCHDRCPLRGSAIIMEFGITPAITKACAGCGVCQHVCPAKAVELVPLSSQYHPPTALPILDAPGKN